MRLEIPWPDLASFPSYGLVRPRQDFDEVLARTAAEGRGPAARADDRDRAAARRAHAAGSIGCRPAKDGDRYTAPVTLVADGNSSRLSLAARPAAPRGPPDGRGVPPVLHQPAARRRLARVVARALGRHAGRRAGCCRATAGSSASVTARSTSGSAILNTSRRVRQDRLPRDARPLAGVAARGVGLRRGERHRPDPRGRAADGLQPRPALRATARCWSATPAAWSTRSTARASPTPWSPAGWPPRSWPRRWPSRPRPAGSGCSRAIPTVLQRHYGGYYTLGRVFVKAIGHPSVMKLLHPPRAAAPDADAVLPEAACQPRGATRRRRDGPDHHRSQPDDPGRLIPARRGTPRLSERLDRQSEQEGDDTWSRS